MAKRSKRRPSRHERDQAGCISGLINVFHFRNGRSTKRLLTDRKQVSTQTEDAGHSGKRTVPPSPTDKCEPLVDTEESKMPMADASKASVKELMEEEMFYEQGPMQQNDAQMGLEQIKSKSGMHNKKNQKKKRSSPKSSDMGFNQINGQISSGNLDLEKILQELADFDQRNTKFLNFDVDIDVSSSEAITVVEEKMVQAVKLFIEQRVSNNSCSQELTDALKTLSSNRGVFMKLLEDPDSELVKHIHNFEDARLRKKDQMAHCSQVGPKPDDLSSQKHRNFFRRRTKSLESLLLREDSNKNCPSPSQIVILKPGLVSPSSLETEIPDNEKNKSASQFSLTEIKRKLRHAMGKEKRGVSPEKLSPKPPNGKYGQKGENLGWRSPNRNHFYTERFTLAGKLKDEVSDSVRLGRSNIYIEAKKHLSEMVKGGDENTESMAGINSVKPLGRILSLPEYNVMPCLSREKNDDGASTAAQTGLSPRGTIKDDQSSKLQNFESLQYESCSNSEEKDQTVGDYSLEIRGLNEEDTIISEVQPEKEETSELRAREEEKDIDILCESSHNSNAGDSRNGDTREVDNEESGSPSFKSHLSLDDQVAVSPSPDHTSTGIEDSIRAIDKIEQPSPVSVLEPLLSDDDFSHAITISHSVEKEIQPRHITFEEQPSIQDQAITCTRISLEDEESPFEYVEAVLLGSGLNWDEFLPRWLSSYKILDSPLFDEVELFSSRPHHDQKLLFDCSNEALEEVCGSYFNVISSPKPSPPKGMDLIKDVWGRVERWLSQNSRPLPLDGLVRRDMAGSTKWMSLGSDVEAIVCKVEETVFDELMEEILVSFGAYEDV